MLSGVAPMPSLRVHMVVPYEGASHDWSMRFHFSGGVPASDADWLTFAEALWTSLKPGILDNVHRHAYTGYVSDASPAVFNSVPASAAGTCSRTGLQTQTAYIAANMYWPTDARDSRNHPIYLRNYVHGVVIQDADACQPVGTVQKAALAAFAQAFSDAGAGFSDGTNTYKRAGPNGAVGLSGLCAQYPSHRILARRG